MACRGKQSGSLLRGIVFPFPAEYINSFWQLQFVGYGGKGITGYFRVEVLLLLCWEARLKMKLEHVFARGEVSSPQMGID